MTEVATPSDGAGRTGRCKHEYLPPAAHGERWIMKLRTEHVDGSRATAFRDQLAEGAVELSEHQSACRSRFSAVTFLERASHEALCVDLCEN